MTKDIPKQSDSSAPEFTFNGVEVTLHGIFIAIHLALVTGMVMDFSSTHPQEDALSPSFLTAFLGEMRDSHDVQWQTYRSNLPILVACIAAWCFLSPFLEKYQNQKSWLFGGVILAYSFRSDLFIYLLILALWYCFTIMCSQRRCFVACCWGSCIALLYLNEMSGHFEGVSKLVGEFMPQWFDSESRQISCGQVLNMTFLKLLSFAIDRHRGGEQLQLQKHQQKCKECVGNSLCLKGRNYYTTYDFSFKSYMNYVLFAPTLLTGPPISYKNFISFRLIPSSKKPQIVRCLFLLVCFEIYQHYFPVIPLTSKQTFIQAQIFALFHLVFIWFKFLIIWRVARVWSALCGVQVVDNLSRCVCNNYGFQGFWRMWHRGFNQWLVRYLYVPLGGNTTLVSVVATIAFVAFWHDHTINIVIWAFALAIFILPEIMIKRYARRSLKKYYPLQWFKYLSALCSAVYIYFLVFSNIVGFGYGAQKMYLIWERVQQEWLKLLWSLVVVSSAVILMFYQRSREDDDRNY